MAKPELIARQSRRPSGWLGEIVARVMAFETEPANRFAIEKLAVQAGEAVLEIGSGHGRTLARIAATPGTFLAGVDPSDVMVRLARKRMRRWIDAGRADVARRRGSALDRPRTQAEPRDRSGSGCGHPFGRGAPLILEYAFPVPDPGKHPQREPRRA